MTFHVWGAKRPKWNSKNRTTQASKAHAHAHEWDAPSHGQPAQGAVGHRWPYNRGNHGGKHGGERRRAVQSPAGSVVEANVPIDAKVDFGVDQKKGMKRKRSKSLTDSERRAVVERYCEL